MRLYYPSKKFPSLCLILILFFFSNTDLSAQQGLTTEFQKLARVYRIQGWDLQNKGDIDGAISLYQKAILLDPNYVVAYNDLGIVFEVKGWLEQAKEMYLKAIVIEPDYPNSYSNLALLYEEQGDYTNAIIYWIKRAMLGDYRDTWAETARKRLEHIARIHPEDFRKIGNQYKKNLQHLSESQSSLSEFKSLQPQESLNLSLFSEDTALDSQKPDNKVRALDYLARAKESFSRGQYVVALKEATVAEYLDSSNDEISAFVDMVRKKLLQ